MRALAWILLLVLAPISLLLLVLWLGLRWMPQSFPPYARRADAPPAPAEWRDELPAPVRRAFEAVLPNGPRQMTSAVVSGRAVLRIKGLTLKARFRFIHDAGRSYRHYFEVTWFGLPILKANESFIEGYPRMALGPMGTFEGTSTLFQAATLGLWAESIWLPSLLVTDARLRWQAVDETHARLFIPSGAGEDQLLVTFDPITGRIAALDALRYREADDDAMKLGWHCAVGDYAGYNGVLAPRQSSIQWSDMPKPWAEWTVEEIVLNADVKEAMRVTGP